MVSGYEYDGMSEVIFIVFDCPACKKPTRISDWVDVCQHCGVKVAVTVILKESNDHGCK